MENIDNKFQELCNWITKNGGFVNPKLQLSDGQYGRTVIATEKIENEKTFEISDNLILNAKTSGLNIPELGFRYSTIVSLLIEYKKPNSFWKEYLELLPHFNEFKNHPVFIYSQGKFPTFSEGVHQKVKTLYDEFLQLYNFFVNYNREWKIIESFTYDEFFWAYLCGITRMWTDIGLVPFADLLQHSNESNMILDQKDGTTFMTTEIIEAGQEVYDNYSVDDISLLTTFGFVDKSPITSAQINFKFEEKEGILKTITDDFNSKIPPAALTISTRGINEILMSYIRVNMLTIEQLKLVNFEIDNIGKEPITLENELLALKKVKLRMSFILSEEEVEYVKNNYNSLNDGSIEKFICDLLIKMDSLKIQINQFVNNYWISLLNN
jgi:hypothetical protein